MRLYFMLAVFRCDLTPNPVLQELFQILRQRGFQVDLGIANEMLVDPSQYKVAHDLYILKSHSQIWLSLAAIYHQQGAPMLDPYQSCLMVHDKILTAYRLLSAGIPAPLTWIPGNLNLLSTLASLHPLVIKPSNGGRGVGVQRINCPGDLATIPPLQLPVVVQEYVPSQQPELKVYVIGDQVFGIRKHDQRRIPCPVSEQVQAIALRCGKVFGLSLFGLDVIEGNDGPRVIDVNYFPSYKGVPNAALLLADHIEACACAGS